MFGDIDFYVFQNIFTPCLLPVLVKTVFYEVVTFRRRSSELHFNIMCDSIIPGWLSWTKKKIFFGKRWLTWYVYFRPMPIFFNFWNRFKFKSIATFLLNLEYTCLKQFEVRQVKKERSLSTWAHKYLFTEVQKNSTAFFIIIFRVR